MGSFRVNLTVRNLALPSIAIEVTDSDPHNDNGTLMRMCVRARARALITERIVIAKFKCAVKKRALMQMTRIMNLEE